MYTLAPRAFLPLVESYPQLPCFPLLQPPQLAYDHGAWLSLNGGSPSASPGVDETLGSQPQPHPVAAGPPGLLDLQGVALRFILLGDPALVPLQSGSHLHLPEDVTALLLAC